MIDTRVIPVSTATSQELLVEITERVCSPYCTSGMMPSATVTFQQGETRLINGNAVATITAQVTVVTPRGDCGCGCASTQVYGEVFDVAFEATGTNVITLTPGATTVVEPAEVKCCKARSVRLTTTITAAIA